LSSLNLSILLVEDDPENLELLKESLPHELHGCFLHYDPVSSFEEAIERISWCRYDIVLTDIFRDKGDRKNGEAEALGRDIIGKITRSRFCPIVAFTDGSFPLSINEKQGPFIKLVEKTKNENIVRAIQELLVTGIPQMSRKLHDELDNCTGPSFLWDFLEKKWEILVETKCSESETLERIIRRRASLQFGRIDPNKEDIEELSEVKASEYYIIPPISKSLRLGHILKHRSNGKIFILFTPHCYLVVQKGKATPKTESVLLVPTHRFENVLKKYYSVIDDSGKRIYKSPFQGKESKPVRLNKAIRNHIKSTPEIGTPEGRYWFLPGFLDIPDSYCDFLGTKSILLKTISQSYEPIAVLDSPFAEAFQASFLSFFSSVGMPDLDPEDFLHLITKAK